MFNTNIFCRNRFDFNLRYPLEDTWMETSHDYYLFNTKSERQTWQTHAFFMLAKRGRHVSEHVCSMDTLITTLKSYRKSGYTITLLDHSLSKRQAYNLKEDWQLQLRLWGIVNGNELTDRDRGEQFKK